jgi:hypothetical protein
VPCVEANRLVSLQSRLFMAFSPVSGFKDS